MKPKLLAALGQGGERGQDNIRAGGVTEVVTNAQHEVDPSAAFADMETSLDAPRKRDQFGHPLQLDAFEGDLYHLKIRRSHERSCLLARYPESADATRNLHQRVGMSCP